jgi:hypothetical protein
MKPELKRIETTLDELEGHPVGLANHGADRSSAVSSSPNPLIPPMHSRKLKPKGGIEPFPLPQNSNGQMPMRDTVLEKEGTSEFNSPGVISATPDDAIVQSFSAQTDQPPLLRSKSPSFSSHRHAANPNLAVGLLKEVEILVKGWQAELEQIVQQIQAIYDEGPIVDGWLESYPPGGQPPAQSASLSVLRHAEINHLMQLVEDICQAEPAPISEAMRRTHYRLCGLDSDGRVWSRSCPPEQVPYVSLAIARYQKLRTLFAKKQALENRLANLVETLTVLHGQISER